MGSAVLFCVSAVVSPRWEAWTVCLPENPLLGVEECERSGVISESSIGVDLGYPCSASHTFVDFRLGGGNSSSKNSIVSR